MSRVDYTDYSDEKLVNLSRSGDKAAENYLLTRYKSIVRMKARAFFLVGGDSDDLIQEGMIALYNAIGTYDETKNASFMTFASLCIDKKLLSAVTADGRDKNKPLNSYMSLYEPLKDKNGEGGVTLSECIPSNGNDNPENIILDEERREILRSNLSKLETQVFTYYIEGMSYEEIARMVNKTPKSIDNAVQRIRSKLRSTFS